MKNRMSDVRNHLVGMLELLGDDTLSPEQAAAAIERAKATSQVAGTYIQAVRTELDAIRLFDDTGKLASVIEEPERVDAKVLSFEGKRRA